MTDKLNPNEQHAKITGYRKLSDVEIDFINRLKDLEADVLIVANELGHHIRQSIHNAELVQDVEELLRLDRSEAGLWLEGGAMTVQTGISQLIRAVAQPENLGYLKVQRQEAAKSQLDSNPDYDIIEEGDGSFDYRFTYDELPEDGTDWTIHKQGSSRWIELSAQLPDPNSY